MRPAMAIPLLAMSSAALGAAAVSPVTQLAGRYSKGFANGLVDGITYLARLKGAREYRDALTEWRTGAKVNP